MAYYQKTILFFSVCAVILSGCSTINNSGYSGNNSSIQLRDSGANMFIVMNDGEEYSGELLRVRDSLMILCNEYKASEKELVDSLYTIYSVKNHDIKLVEIKNKGNPVTGAVLGSATGIAIGAIVGKGKAEKPPPGTLGPDLWILDENVLFGGCVGGIAGALIGGIIAYNITTDNKAVYERVNSGEYDFTWLNFYARYKNEEPEYLKKIK